MIGLLLVGFVLLFALACLIVVDFVIALALIVLLLVPVIILFIFPFYLSDYVSSGFKSEKEMLLGFTIYVTVAWTLC